MRCDLILKMLIWVGGQQLQQGAADFPFLGKEMEVFDHILWLIGGVSECKWAERAQAWYPMAQLTTSHPFCPLSNTAPQNTPSS